MIATRKGHRLTSIMHLTCTLKLSIGHQGPAEGDASDVGAQVSHGLDDARGWVSVQVGVLDHELGDAGEDSCQPHEAVEGRHQLRQVCDFNALGDGQTCR